MRGNLGMVFLSLLVASFCAIPATSQTTFGSITGTVTDPSGAVVPNATVTVINEGTGAVRRVTSGSAGVFNALDLGVGTYSVSVTAAGFATYKRASLNLSAHQVIDLNVSLTLGSTATVMQVMASSPAINTTNSTLSRVDLEQFHPEPSRLGHNGLECFRRAL